MTSETGFTAEETRAFVEANGKRDKAEVNYIEPANTPENPCEYCVFFEPEQEKPTGECFVVDGQVVWFGHCDYYIEAEGVRVDKLEPTCEPCPKVAFVGAMPSRIDMARGEYFAGPAGETLQQYYLDPLGLKRSDTLLMSAIPVVLKDDRGRDRYPEDADVDQWRAWVQKTLERYNPALVIALGRLAKDALGDVADLSLPHPMGLRRHGDSGQVLRKLRRIVAEVKSGRVSKSVEVPILKVDKAKQVVYGVVLDPYQVDSEGDWIPPAAIEETAHAWMKNSRVIGYNHTSKAAAYPVESWVERYPTPEDYKAAMALEPHKAYKLPFGSDVVHSGAWVLGTKLSDDLWQQHLDGELDAYSIGGSGHRTPVAVSAMPEVEFLTLTAGETDPTE